MPDLYIIAGPNGAGKTTASMAILPKYLHIHQAKEHVKYRVLNGGHNIPVIDIERRYTRSLQNLVNHYCKACHNWYVLDNSTSETTLVAEVGSNKDISIINNDIWNQIQQYVS